MNKELVNSKQHLDGSTVEKNLVLQTEVLIIGTGAGGGVSAEILSNSGKQVIMVEEGSFNIASDFVLHEREAYKNLYKENSARRTKDNAIGILQGHTVGGSTTVNWCSSFRTPDNTLAHWEKFYGLQEVSNKQLDPWFEKMEKRLNIAPWALPLNGNNSTLEHGLEALGLSAKIIARNVKGCANLGYCGQGCPLNAKQSMLVTTIPSAIRNGAQLTSRVKAERLLIRNGRVTGAKLIPSDQTGRPKDNITITVNAERTIVSAGAIGSPALLLRSNAPDPYKRLGSHTCLHPTSMVFSVMPNSVNAYEGAPQSVYCDDFLWREDESKIGYMLEAIPLHPVALAAMLPPHGTKHSELMRKFPHLQATASLIRDGFHAQSVGGRVAIDKYGNAILDYPLNDYIWEGIRDSMLRMTEIAFAAGAVRVLPAHSDASLYSDLKTAKAEIMKLSMQEISVGLSSAHVMGGCNMGADARLSVVDESGAHHQLENLWVLDGSIFPTSIGANPQLSIYGLIAKLATKLL